jgi:TPR repeat protein
MYRFLAVFVLLAVLVNAGCQKKTPDMLSCDDLAAHPEDKDKVGAGKADNSIDVELAIKQCSAAVEQNPQVARFQFQLGRAFWAGKRYDEALDALLKADEQGYTPADFYIGQAYEQGLVEGEAPDIGLARDLYMIAASDGFPPAARSFQ